MTKIMCIHVGNSDMGPVYFVVRPHSSNENGIVGNLPIPFWSYVTREQVSRLMDTPFHEELWNGKQDAAWNAKFLLRDTPLTGHDISMAGNFVVAIKIQTVE